MAKELLRCCSFSRNRNIRIPRVDRIKTHTPGVENIKIRIPRVDNIETSVTPSSKVNFEIVQIVLVIS
jgi:hypothetical protein